MLSDLKTKNGISRIMIKPNITSTTFGVFDFNIFLVSWSPDRYTLS
jgi:hypothetical protein